MNLNCGIKLGNVYRLPSNNVHILGLHLDSRLTWSSHLKADKIKLDTQLLALNRLTGRTWGLPMVEARQVYSMVIRPAMVYMALAWFTPLAQRQTRLFRHLEHVQIEYLRSVFGAFKLLRLQPSTASLTFHRFTSTSQNVFSPPLPDYRTITSRLKPPSTVSQPILKPAYN